MREKMRTGSWAGRLKGPGFRGAERARLRERLERRLKGPGLGPATFWVRVCREEWTLRQLRRQGRRRVTQALWRDWARRLLAVVRWPVRRPAERPSGF